MGSGPRGPHSRSQTMPSVQMGNSGQGWPPPLPPDQMMMGTGGWNSNHPSMMMGAYMTNHHPAAMMMGYGGSGGQYGMMPMRPDGRMANGHDERRGAAGDLRGRDSSRPAGGQRFPDDRDYHRDSRREYARDHDDRGHRDRRESFGDGGGGHDRRNNGGRGPPDSRERSYQRGAEGAGGGFRDRSYDQPRGMRDYSGRR